MMDIINCPILPMKQLSFAASEFAKKPKQTRREKFLLEMDAVVP